jgi:hypothetical protein
VSGTLGVIAFVLVVLELVAAAGAAVLVRRFWRQVEPQVRPLLAMFTPPPAPTAAEAERMLERELGPEDERPGELAS